MKIISFSATEILPSLLNRTKIQTIRPLKMRLKKNIPTVAVAPSHTEIIDLIDSEEPRFKVGEEAKLMWKQRSKYKHFCYKCGRAITNPDPNPKYTWDCKHNIKNNEAYPISKFLGVVKISEIFKIMIWIDNDGVHIERDGKELNYFQKTQLAFLDGFRNDYENMRVESTVMMDWFKKKYDLSSRKMFAVYKWKWL